MNESRRKFLAIAANAVGIVALPLTMEAVGAEAKPLTTAGLARTLLGLADRAEGQGMRDEAQAIYAAVQVVLKGTKASKGGAR